MKKRLPLFALLVLVLALLLPAAPVFAVVAPAIPAGSYDWRILDAVENKVIELTNNFRTQNGLQTLQKAPGLRYTALYKSLYMAHYDDFDYNFYQGPLAGNNWNAPYVGFVVGENICFQVDEFPWDSGQIDTIAQMLFDYWREDGAENILRDDFTHVGVGVITINSIMAYGEQMKNVCYAVQHFSNNLTTYNPNNLPERLSAKAAVAGTQPGRPATAGDATPTPTETPEESPTPTFKRTPPPRPSPLTPTPTPDTTATPDMLVLPPVEFQSFAIGTDGAPPTVTPGEPIWIPRRSGPDAGTLMLFGLLGSALLAAIVMGIYLLVKRRKQKILKEVPSR